MLVPPKDLDDRILATLIELYEYITTLEKGHLAMKESITRLEKLQNTNASALEDLLDRIETVEQELEVPLSFED